MRDLKRRITRIEQERAKQDRPSWRSVHICTEDHKWCVSDKDGIRYGQGEPYPEQLPGEARFVTNIRVDAI